MNLRSIQQAIVRAFVGDPGDPEVVDFCPVTGATDWRTEKLAEAAEKYGRPFKCAADFVPHERMAAPATEATAPIYEPVPAITAPTDDPTNKPVRGALRLAGGKAK